MHFYTFVSEWQMKGYGRGKRGHKKSITRRRTDQKAKVIQNQIICVRQIAHLVRPNTYAQAGMTTTCDWMKPEDDRQCSPELGSKIPRTFTKDHEPVQRTREVEMVNHFPPSSSRPLTSYNHNLTQQSKETNSCDVNARKQG